MDFQGVAELGGDVVRPASATSVGPVAAIGVSDRVSSPNRDWRTLEVAVRCIPQPALVVDSQGQVILLNHAMRMYLAAGAPFVVHDGRLVALPDRYPVDHRRLRLWDRQRETCGQYAQIRAAGPSLRGAGTLCLRIQWLDGASASRESDSGDDALVVLYPQNLSFGLSTRAVRDTYGLTAAEVCLVERLFGGRTLSEVAVDLRITRETARKHLSRVFRKVGVESQPQLMHRIATGPFFGNGRL